MDTNSDKRLADALDHFLNSVSEDMDRYIGTLQKEQLYKAADLIYESVARGGRVHVTGIGKPSHIAGYIASLMSSTGTPSYYLHGTEAVHGSCGQLKADDVVIVISNSGKTPEMKVLVEAIRNNCCRIVGVSGNEASWLSSKSDIHLLADIIEEGGPLNRAPRISVLNEILILQSLSVILQARNNIDPLQYVKWHPGGTLGKLRDNER